MPDKYQVLVGNIGCVYSGDDREVAERMYLHYVNVYPGDEPMDEPVTLTVDGEPDPEFDYQPADYADDDLDADWDDWLEDQ